MKRRALTPLVTFPDSSPQGSAGSAAVLARLLEADLHALTLVAEIREVSNALSRMMLDVTAMTREAEKRSKTAATLLLQAVGDAAKAQAVSMTSESVAAAPELFGEVAARHARYFDCSIVGWEPGNRAVCDLAEALMFGSGRPVFLLPGAAPKTLDRIAIAWDGSAAAAGAVAAASSLIAGAREVTVLTAADDKPLEERAPGERMNEALRLSDVDAKFVEVKAMDEPIEATLQDAARDAGVDLMVMGAYGHSRMRDFVLGGATKGVLADLRLPLMLVR